MKRKLLLFILLFPCLCKGQFVLSGSSMTTEDSKGYIVYEFEGEKQNDLYKKAYTAITMIYNSSKDVVSSTENNIISVNGLSEGRIYFNSMGKRPLKVLYKINILFKDGKVRFDAPSIISCQYMNNNLYLTKGSKIEGCLYTKRGEIRYPEFKDSLENEMNTIVGTIITYMKKNTLIDNW